VLCASDLTAILASWSIGYLAWARLELNQPASLYLTALPLLVLFCLFYAASGLYPGLGLGNGETIKRLCYSTSVSFLMVAAACFALKADLGYSRVAFVIAWALGLILVPVFRFLTAAIASRFRWWPEPAVIFGSLPQIKVILRAAKQAGFLGYTIVGALCPDTRLRGHSCGSVPILGGLDLVPQLSSFGVCTVLALESPSTVPRLATIQEHTLRLVCISNKQHLPVEHVRVRWLGQNLGLEYTNHLLRLSNRLIKRSLDLALATVALVVTAPLILVAGGLIKLVSPGPVFFRQQRQGLRARRFTVWKLRTMYPDAEARLGNVLATNSELKAEWEQNAKLREDPRVIPFCGRFLRRFSVDELPQLWNVLAGDMSLVGPRPLPTYHLEMLAPECRRLRSVVRPGLTGMWQVMVRGDGDLRDHERFDPYYVRNWSIWLDLYLLARTVMAVVLGRGAY
jgi:Undecaprenyl-phosphate galactose phosphotransferase WbaP